MSAKAEEHDLNLDNSPQASEDEESEEDHNTAEKEPQQTHKFLKKLEESLSLGVSLCDVWFTYFIACCTG